MKKKVLNKQDILKHLSKMNDAQIQIHRCIKEGVPFSELISKGIIVSKLN